MIKRTLKVGKKKADQLETTRIANVLNSWCFYFPFTPWTNHQKILKPRMSNMHEGLYSLAESLAKEGRSTATQQGMVLPPQTIAKAWAGNPICPHQQIQSQGGLNTQFLTHSHRLPMGRLMTILGSSQPQACPHLSTEGAEQNLVSLCLHPNSSGHLGPATLVDSGACVQPPQGTARNESEVPAEPEQGSSRRAGQGSEK